MNKYDVIIIGSGISSLVCASILTQLYAKKVLLLEMHEQIGGFSQSFYNSEGYSWEFGIHHVGAMEKSSILFKILDFATKGNSSWTSISNIPYRFIYPSFEYPIHSPKEAQIEYLKGLFPREKDSIVEFYNTTRKLADWYRFYNSKLAQEGYNSKVTSLLNSELGLLGSKTTWDYISSITNNEDLKALLTSQWVDYGIPPSQSSLFLHCAVVDHYSNGSYYPQHGAKGIIESLKAVVVRGGGQILTSTHASEIICINNKAVGVAIDNPAKSFFANTIISGIGIYNTYGKLLQKSITPDELFNLNSLTTNSTSTFNLYLGLNQSAECVGGDGSNYWIMESFDHEQTYKNRSLVLEGIISQCNFSFPSHKKEGCDKHTMEISCCVGEDTNRKLKAMSNNEMIKTKQIIEQLLLDKVSIRIPNIRNHIVSKTLSTPLAIEKITGHRQGCIFGLPFTKEKLIHKWFLPSTNIENLFLTGSDIVSPGIAGAIISGVNTAGAIHNDRSIFLKIFNILSQSTIVSQ